MLPSYRAGTAVVLARLSESASSSLRLSSFKLRTYRAADTTQVVVVVVVVIQKVAPGVTAQACSVTYQSLSPVGTVYARLYTYIEI